jgi:FkbM family methyltransferase
MTRRAATFSEQTGKFFRQGVQQSLTLFPKSWSSFLYRQIKGLCRDLGGVTDVLQEVRLRTGGRMVLDIRDSQQRHIYYSRLYEYPYVAWLQNIIKSGDSFVDVGANIGFYTIWAALRVGSTGRVFSFEPNPLSYGFLEKNIELNELGNVNPYQVAVGGADGIAQLEARFDDLALSRIVRGETSVATSRRLQNEKVIRVVQRRLDTFFSDAEKTHIKFIKIDAEGAEPEILRGGETLLEKRPRLLIEVDDRRLGPLGHSEEDLLALLTRYEYVPFRLNRVGQLKPFQLSAKKPTRDNLFFIPRKTTSSNRFFLSGKLPNLQHALEKYKTIGDLQDPSQLNPLSEGGGLWERG